MLDAKEKISKFETALEEIGLHPVEAMILCAYLSGWTMVFDKVGDDEMVTGITAGTPEYLNDKGIDIPGEEHE